MFFKVWRLVSPADLMRCDAGNVFSGSSRMTGLVVRTVLMCLRTHVEIILGAAAECRGWCSRCGNIYMMIHSCQVCIAP